VLAVRAWRGAASLRRYLACLDALHGVWKKIFPFPISVSVCSATTMKIAFFFFSKKIQKKKKKKNGHLVRKRNEANTVFFFTICTRRIGIVSI
jgi:hypothetical protein